MDEIQDVFVLLCSSMKLERDKGIIELEKLLSKINTINRHKLQKHLLSLMSNNESSWETKYGCLLGAKSLIPNMNQEDEGENEALLLIKENSQKLLVDSEVRVRLAAGEVLGCLCYKIGYGVYEESKDNILKLIRNNLERNISEEDSSSKLEQFETGKLVEKLVGGTRRMSGSDAAQVFQDTAGWKNLETSLKALQAMIEGCGPNFYHFVDEELLTLVFKTLRHPNRFVRETGFYVCSSLVCSGNTAEELELSGNISNINPIYTYGGEFADHLAEGLADNWSQVRLSASVTARNLLVSLPNEEIRQSLYPQLLPRLCLNRYYVADGVRIYSQETWRQIMGAKGKDLVESYIGPTVEYYITATKSDNHAVREAACACIAELASKISPDVVSPYVDELLSTLLVCFKDDSWPVRDAACLACGNFIACYPDQSKPLLDALYPMFCSNLADPIRSVRQGAASALCNVVRAYGDDMLGVVAAHIQQGLENIKAQPSESEKQGHLDKGPGRYGVVKRMKDSELDLHADRQVYSCGSLNTRSGKGSTSSSITTTKRDPQPWEIADGCAQLLTELSCIRECHTKVVDLVPLLMEAARVRHYTHHVVLLETVCKQIPVVAKNLGKPVFKLLLDDMLDIVFYALESENALTSSAASQCVTQLASFLGHNILRARVANLNPRYLHFLESAIYISPL